MSQTIPYKRSAAVQTKTRHKKRIVRGATREQEKARLESRRWGRYGLLLLFVSGLVWGGSQLPWQRVYEKAYSAANRPLANIGIESEFRYVSKAQLKTLISAKLNGSFVDLDLQGIKQALEDDPWVERVVIERLWPDSLKLTVIEHTPIARWNNNGYINREGVLIKVASNEALAHLPLLSGDQSQSRELAKNYFLFSELLKINKLRITELSLSPTKAWELRIDADFALALGSENIEQRLRDFQFVYENHLKTEKQRLARIDMRYEKGLAVEWKEDATLMAASSGQ